MLITVSCGQGLNADGQLGDGTTTKRLTPTLVHFDGWWKAAAAGDYHSCGIRTDGSLWCWVRHARPANAGCKRPTTSHGRVSLSSGDCIRSNGHPN